MARSTNGNYKLSTANLGVVDRQWSTRKCAFCRECKVDKETLTCANCGTTEARNYGANQIRNKHGKKITGTK
jgi:hypothetical protein